MTELDDLLAASPTPRPAAADVMRNARGDLHDLVRQARKTPRRSWLMMHRRHLVTAGVATLAIGGLGGPLLLSAASPADSGPPSQAGPAPVATTPAERPVTSDQLLLSAASYAELQATTGKYFRNRQLSIHRSQRIGTGAASYRLEQRTMIENWTGAPGQKSYYSSRHLSAKPATASDREKWLADGAPKQWNLGPADSAEARDVIITMGPGKARFGEATDSDRYYLLGDKSQTAAEIAKLPTDPAALRALFLKDKAADVAEARWLLGKTHNLLFWTPAPPAVRAAAFRMLAGTPGLKVEPGIRDGLGRTGTGITATGNGDTHQLVIDPNTGRLLSGRYNSQNIKIGENLALESGWTNATPKPLPATAK
ncbi:CU044_5270 family protein [Kribbella sp. NBC_01245]|uniref:CU044_5270 family protein n=1 Tax=Kribbella sp. NBC_01245 TaxID=2903578 RepID=UPI002E2B4674|nr:CU044_5270 family protein [Kribbella sp. NBC_01245]